MNEDLQLKLQAHLDGELSDRENRNLEASLAGDAEARALLTELRNTNAALAGFEADVKTPGSREFYWSKIQREIQRLEKVEAAPAARVPAWRRFLFPATAFAAVAIFGLLTAMQMGWLPGGASSGWETALTDTGAVTYRDEAQRMTVVWLSYPADNAIADSDPEDTIQ